MVVGAVVAMSVTTASAGAAELLVDGGFESAVGNDSAAFAQISQDVFIPNTGSATLSFWLWWEAAGSDETLTVSIDGTPLATAQTRIWAPATALTGGRAAALKKCKKKKTKAARKKGRERREAAGLIRALSR